MAVLICQLTRLCPGSSGLVKPVDIDKSSAYHKGGSVRGAEGRCPHAAEQRESLAAMALVYGQTLSLKTRKSCCRPTRAQQYRDLAEGQVQLSGGCEAARSVRLGWRALVVGTI